MNDSLPRLLITGGRGQLGRALETASLVSHFTLFALSHDELDITKPPSILQVLSHFRPDIVINAAAFTAVDKAETSREAALQTNYIGAKNLAMACSAQGLTLIHTSTAYIFDGEKSSPYVEDDKPGPLSVYGESKYLGEEAVLQNCERSIILRITSVFSEHGHNFLKTILQLAKQKKELSIVADQITSPTYAGDIATAILTLAANPLHFGTYHYSNSHPVSWYEFAAAIIQEAKLHSTLSIENLKAVATAEYKTAAKRPTNSVLECHKIYKDYGIRQSDWKDAVKKIVKPLIINDED